MTPREKAQELMLKYYNRIEHKLSIDYIGHDWDISKECALIAVDELIKESEINHLFLNAGVSIYYWQEVKKEIEAL